jgi:hypothetical protein
MSATKSVLEFFAKVASDKGLQARLQELSRKHGGATDAAVDELLSIARGVGCTFSKEDYAAVRNAPPEEMASWAMDVSKDHVPYECTEATAWQGHPPEPHGCAIAWGCGVQHPMYGGPHIPICTNRPV